MQHRGDTAIARSRGRGTARVVAAAAPDRPLEAPASHRAGRSAPRDRGLRSRPGAAPEDRISTVLGRQRGGAHELATQAILDSLEAAGIRALGLKGVCLRALCTTMWPGAAPAISTSSSLSATSRARSRSWRRWTGAGSGRRIGRAGSRSCTRSSRIPRCHEWSCTGACTGTRIALPRPRSSAQSDRTRAPLRMLPADGLATLTLIYARDGLSGPEDSCGHRGLVGYEMRRRGSRCPGSTRSPAPTRRSKHRCAWATDVTGPRGLLIRRSSQQRFRWTVAAELATPSQRGRGCPGPSQC